MKKITLFLPVCIICFLAPTLVQVEATSDAFVPLLLYFLSLCYVPLVYWRFLSGKRLWSDTLLFLLPPGLFLLGILLKTTTGDIAELFKIVLIAAVIGYGIGSVSSLIIFMIFSVKKIPKRIGSGHA